MSNTDNYKLLGCGATSDVYRIDDQKVLKLFKPNISREMVLEEKERSEYLNGLGVSSPKVFALCEEDGRLGLILENMGSSTLLDAITEYPEKAREYGRMYGELAVSIHKHPADEQLPGVMAVFLSGRKGLEEQLAEAKIKAPKELSAWLDRQMASFPKDEGLLHGDLSPGNVMVRGGELYVIDAMTLRSGPAFYDYLPGFMFAHIWPELKKASLNMTEEEKTKNPYFADFIKPFESRAVAAETGDEVWQGFLDAVYGQHPPENRTFFTSRIANLNYLKYAVMVWNLGFLPEGKRIAISQWAIDRIDGSFDIFGKEEEIR